MLFPVRVWISDIHFYNSLQFFSWTHSVALSVLINAFARVGNADLC